jgi:hypothetical protein
MDYLILFYEMKDRWKTYKAIIWLKEILLEVEQAIGPNASKQWCYNIFSCLIYVIPAGAIEFF